MKKINFYDIETSRLESLYVLDALQRKDFSRGKYIEKFTNLLKEYIGCEYVSLVNSGTAACHLAMLSLGVNKEWEIIIPSITYVATANAVKYCGGIPVFVDVDEDTWNINVDLAETLITKNTKSIFYVDILGNVADVPSLLNLCSKNDIFLANDGCQSLGSKYNNIEACNFANVSVSSFFSSKIISSGGEGGMVCTNSKMIYDRVEHYKGQAQTSQYFHNKIGFNFRLNNVSAAIGFAQLQHIDNVLAKKKYIYKLYRDFLEDYPIKFQKIDNKTTSNYWVTGIQFENKKITDKIKKSLTGQLVEWRRMFYPLNQFPMYKECRTSTMDVANRLTDTVILLPSHSLLEFDDVEYICDVIKRNF